MARPMTTVPITVVIPIGPMPHHCKYLAECLDSLLNQSVQPDEYLLIDDMHGLREHCPQHLSQLYGSAYGWDTWRAPWRLGMGAAVNCGVGLARNEAVILLAGDDMLLPGAIEAAWNAYQANESKDAFYWFGVRYSDGQDDQHLPWGGGMVTKGLWQMTGGYDPWMCPGDADAELCSIMLQHMPERLIAVDPRYPERVPYYWFRVHGESNSSKRDAWWGVMLEARKLVTNQFTPPQWNRFTR